MKVVRRPRTRGAARLAAVLAAGVALALSGGLPARAASAADPAVLAMTSSVSPSPLVIGGTAVYTVTVSNTGDAAAANVTTTLPFGPTARYPPAPRCPRSARPPGRR